MDPADLLAPESATGAPAPFALMQAFKVAGFTLHMGPMHLWYAGTALAAGLSMDETRRVLSMGRHPVSLDRPVGESEDSCFGEFIEDNGLPRPERSASNVLLRDKIESLLKTLTYREREIIRLRYGLGDGYTYTLEEVGRIFRVTRERVRQIEAKAVRKLRHPVRARQLASFLDGVVLPDESEFADLRE